MMDMRHFSQLEGLMFTARTLVEGLYAGGHPTPRHGPGLEFHDYRPYVPGDDPAAVDWKLFGRTDRYYVRRHQRYSDLHVHLLVDASASMNFASLGPADDAARTKWQVARELAAAIAFLTVRQGDRAALALGGEALRDVLPLSGTWPHLQRCCAALEQAAPGGAGDLGACLAHLHALRPRRGLVVVISDLLDEPAGLFGGLSRLRHDRFELIVFQVLTPAERRLAAPPGPRDMRMLDPETAGHVDANLRELAADYRARIDAHVQAVRRGCQARGADHRLVQTDRPVLESLRQYLVHRTTVGV